MKPFKFTQICFQFIAQRQPAFGFNLLYTGHFLTSINSLFTFISQIQKRAMHQMQAQNDQLSDFYQLFQILQHSQQSTIVASEKNTFLIKNIKIEEPQNINVSNSYRNNFNREIQQMLNTLSQHQQFDQKYMLTLLRFQVVPKKLGSSDAFIRAIYQYGQTSLKSQIQKRSQTEMYFQEDELWVLLSSLAHPLSYLQSRNVVYGVLDTCRIFLDNKIKLLDPSCTGINPYQLEQGRIYSPELLQVISSNEEEGQGEIDMFKSDIYILGMILIQVALLNPNLTELDEDNKEECFEQIHSRYSEQFCHMLRLMLSYDPEERPTFNLILDQLSQMFEFSTNQIETLQPSSQEKQDCPNQHQQLTEGEQLEFNDILFDESTSSEDQIMTQYEIARKKYKVDLDRSIQQKYSEMNSFSQSLNLTNNSIVIEQTSIFRSVQRKKGGYKTRQLKQKLINPRCERITGTQNNGRVINMCTQTVEKDQKKRSATKDTQNNDKPYQNMNQMSNKENLLTNPQLLTMIRQCRKEIEEKTANSSDRRVHFHYANKNNNL